MSRSKNTS